MLSLKSKWQGPYSVVANSKYSWIAEIREATWPGVYMWTAEVGDVYRPYYIGIARLSIIARTLQHLADYYKGMSRIERPKDFRSGVLGTPVFSPPAGSQWRSQIEGAQDSLIELFHEIRFFFAPIFQELPDGKDRSVLERVETALIDSVRESQSYPNPESKFLSNVRRSRCVTDRKILVQILDNEKIEGVPSEFRV